MTVVARAAVDDTGFIVRLEEFSGPLDLLLTLIREQEIDITDIPIAQIADQFVAAIHGLGLNQAADYLEMAARLLRIKIQLLLPRPLNDEDWEDPRAELVRRLLEYEQVHEIVGWLTGRATLRADRFPRGWTPPDPERPPPPLILDLAQLLQTVDDVIRAMPQPLLHRVVPRPLDVEGATRRVEALLRERGGFDLREAFGPAPTPADVISTLLAILELARLGRVRLVQATPFGTVDIRRGPTEQAA
ncbi:MAG: segregation/condensation protein A [Gemmatimonadota bacterium]|nr:segregation/condensation protein A [Gemmatimonadota bacterium]